MPTCTSCQAELPSGSRFCPSCGDATERVSSAETIARDTAPTLGHHGRFEPGQRLGTRYRIVGLLGKGGMGEVYRADDLELGQSVALKFLPERLAAKPVELERLRREVRIAREIAHPNVCRTYDIAQADGHTFLVMEYIDGEDLESVLRRMGRPSSDKALEIARQLCLGLAAAHEDGILHRDLKPANIMIDGRGRVRITDFGLAGLAEDLAEERSAGGTPGYMAPEQLAHGHVSVQSDIYSLGLILYETLTGKRVFDSRDPAELRRLHSESAIMTPSSLVSDVDPVVERVVLRCLEADPHERPSSAYQVLAALPGGDPLAAALEAGETPSPELVANAGGAGSLRPTIAVGCFLYVVAAFAIHTAWQHGSFASFTESPRGLEFKAEQVLKAAGIDEPPRHSATGFLTNDQLGAFLESADSLATESPDAERPPVVFFWRRWSPRLMVHSEIHASSPQLTDPPQSTPGSVSVLLDAQGRLVGLQAVPIDTLEAAGPPSWNALLTAAGFDPGELTPIPVPAGVSVARADTIAAWRGRDFGSNAEVTLLAGAFRGRAVHFSMEWGWGTTTHLETLETMETLPSGVTGWVAFIVLFLGPMVASVVIASHNLRMGRGDLRGATILGIAGLVIYLLEAWFQFDISELGLMQTMSRATGGQPMGHALLHAAQIWFAYVAIEPYVRRLWPRVLVSWARLVAGRYRDPIVGRDLLAGGVFAATIVLLFRVAAGLAGTGRFDPASASWIGCMSGLRDTLSIVASLAAVSMVSTVLFFTTLLVLRILLRRSLPAVIGAVLVYGGVTSALFHSWNLPFAPVLGMTWAAAGAFLAIRFGFLALLSGIFLRFVALVVPWTFDVSSWVSELSLVGAVVVLGIVGYGFITALGGQRLLPDLVSEAGDRLPRAERRS